MLSPITFVEFVSALKSCQPPHGWGKRIAVAYSGGPDSTCLLFLLHSVLNNPLHHSTDLPTSVHALSIDHGLQKASSSMAEHCAKFARDRGIPHIELRIPWGDTPFPAKPAAGQPFERIARDARQRLLLDWMVGEGVSTLATGHHADDNVETFLLGQLRSEVSRQTIDHVRRWGMGDRVDRLNFAGLAGMRSFLVRPLLPFSKDRILATCNEHKLSYVVDPTNFQPDLTPRNAVRQILTEKGHMPCSDFCASTALELSDGYSRTPGDEEKQQSTRHSREEILRCLLRIVTRSCDLSISEQDTRVVQILRDLSAASSRRKTWLDEQALEFVQKHRHPSVDSTLLLLRENIPQDSELRRAIIYRIIRFVSPFPWGSVTSQAHRDTVAVDAIAHEVWNRRLSEASPFTRGSLVKWTPVVVSVNGKFRIFNESRPLKYSECIGWLATRQPSYIGQSGDSADHNVDVTPAVVSALQNGHGLYIDILFDCRFNVRIFLDSLPEEYRSMMISGEGALVLAPSPPYWLPSLEWHPAHGIWGKIPMLQDDSVLWEASLIRVI